MLNLHYCACIQTQSHSRCYEQPLLASVQTDRHIVGKALQSKKTKTVCLQKLLFIKYDKKNNSELSPAVWSGKKKGAGGHFESVK